MNLYSNILRFKSYGIGLVGCFEHRSSRSYNWIVSNDDDDVWPLLILFIDVGLGSNR